MRFNNINKNYLEAFNYLSSIYDRTFICTEGKINCLCGSMDCSDCSKYKYKGNFTKEEKNNLIIILKNKNPEEFGYCYFEKCVDTDFESNCEACKRKFINKFKL